MAESIRPPKVFISYAWEDDAHDQWVVDFAARLREDGVESILDRWAVRFGGSLTSFMEKAIRDNDFVLLICTPKYKEKFDERLGGLGYEAEMITGKALYEKNREKFIPVLRKGTQLESIPTWMISSRFVNLGSNPYSEDNYVQLLATLLGKIPDLPAIGKPRDFTSIDLTPKELRAAREKYLREFIKKYSPQSSSPIESGSYERLPLMQLSPLQKSFEGGVRTELPSIEPRRYNDLSKISDLPKKFILSGPHGSGKTTLLRRQALEAAHRALQDVNEPIPILIEAWEWQSDDPFGVFVSNLRKDLRPLWRSLSDIGNPNDLIASQKVILYIDGLDELSQGKLIGLENTIRDIDVMVITTYRVNNYEGRAGIDLPEIAILPLEIEDIRRFAESSLGREKGREFTTKIWSWQEGHKQSEEKDLANLTQIPFFLNIMFVYYREKGWLYAPNRWTLLKYAVDYLWEAGLRRIVEIDQSEIKRYRNITAITDVLSELALQNLSRQFIPYEQIRSRMPEAFILRALAEGGLISISGTGVRFRHDLIAEFFAAHQFMNAELEPIVRDPVLSGVLVALAYYSDKHRQDIQRTILKIFDEDVLAGQDRYGWQWASDSDIDRHGLLWVLGEIGDRDAAKWLLDYVSRNQDDTAHELMRVLAKIVNLLPDEQEEKQQTIEILGQILLENIEPSGIGLYRGLKMSELVGYLSKCIDATKALAEIKSDASAKLLIERFREFIKHTQSGMGLGPGFFDVYRREFAHAFSKMGEPVVNHLLRLVADQDPDIAITASEALAWTFASLPPQRCFPMLVRHPVSIVRAEIAFALGEQLDSEAIPYLINALNDTGIVPRGSAGHYGGMHTTFIYVSDYAMGALSKFSSAEARTALINYGYSEEGSWTIELLMERLESEREISPTGELRTQWARYVAGMNGGLDLLLPRLGHLEHAPDIPCPIVAAIRQRVTGKGERPIDTLLKYIHEARDRVSRMEALLLVAEMGDQSLDSELQRIIESEPDEALRVTAGGAMAILVARHSARYSLQRVKEIEEIIVAALDRNTVDGNRGLGRGLGQIAVAAVRGNRNEGHIDFDLPDARLIKAGVTNAVRRIGDSTAQGIKVGLAVLEEVAGALEVNRFNFEDIVEKELAERVTTVIESSPSYLIRRALNELEVVRYLAEADDAAIQAEQQEIKSKLLTSGFPRRGFISQETRKALQDLESAVNLKYSKWAETFTEADWEASGCEDGLIYFLRGQALNFAGMMNEARQSWTRCVEFYQSQVNLSQEQRARLTRALITLATVNRDSQEERAFVYSQQAVEAARDLSHARLRFEALGLLADFCRHRNDWERMIPLCDEAISVVKNISHAYEENLEPLMLRAMAYLESENYPAALGSYREALEFAEQYGLLEKSIEVRTGMAVLYGYTGAAEEFRKELQRITRFYDDIQDWERVVNLMMGIGERVKNASQQIMLYKSALDYSEKLGEKVDIYQVAFALRNLIGTYLESGEEGEAEANYRHWIQRMTERDLQEGTAILSVDYTYLLARLGRWEEAEETIKAALELLGPSHEMTPVALQALAMVSDHFSSESETEPEDDEKEEGLSLAKLLELVERAASGDKELGSRLFPAAQRMAADSSTPPEYRAFGKVLVNILAGSRNPNLEGLPDELASPIRDMLVRLRR